MSVSSPSSICIARSRRNWSSSSRNANVPLHPGARAFRFLLAFSSVAIDVAGFELLRVCKGFVWHEPHNWTK